VNPLDRLLGPRRYSVVPVGVGIPQSELGPAVGPIPGLELGTLPRNRRTYPFEGAHVVGLATDASGTDLVGEGLAGEMVTPHIDPSGGVYQSAATAGVGRAPTILGGLWRRRTRSFPPFVQRPGVPTVVPADQVQTLTEAVDPGAGAADVAVTFDGQPAHRDAAGRVHVSASAETPAFTYTPGEHLVAITGDSPESSASYARMVESLLPGANLVGEATSVGADAIKLMCPSCGGSFSPAQQAQNRALLAAYESSPEYAALEAEIDSPSYAAEVQATLADQGRER